MRRILLWLLVLPTLAFSQAYPSRPVHMIIPFAPGGASDFVGRIIQPGLAEGLGQSIVIDNRPGASGNIGMEAAAKAAPDGYTIYLGNIGTVAINPGVFTKLAVHPARDFIAVTQVVDVPGVLVAHPSFAPKSVQEFVEYAKANPGKVNMASAGVGATSHLAGVILQQLGKFEALHVPHKGGGPSVGSVVSGQTHFTFAPAPAAMSQVKAGRLRAIAHSLPARSNMLGDMPAVNETLPGYDYSTWAGIVAPKGVPKTILDKVHAALVKTLEIPAVKEGLAAQGAEIRLIPGEEYRKFIAQDVINTARFVQAAGLKQE